MNVRGHVDFVGQRMIDDDDISAGAPVDNIIWGAGGPAEQWLQESTETISNWRAAFRSSYLRWAIAINGLDQTAKKYEVRDPEDGAFLVHSLRTSGHRTELAVVAKWSWPEAAENHSRAMPALAAFGVIDLYAYLELAVLELFRTYLRHNPATVITGPDFRELRRLHVTREDDDGARAAWDTAIEERLNQWQEKRSYESLSRVFRTYCGTAGLRTPSRYRHTTLETWAESIDGLGLLRHALVHSHPTVSADLATFSTLRHSMTFDFEEGAPIVVRLDHLMSVELFVHDLLTGLNLSLIEYGAREFKGVDMADVSGGGQRGRGDDE